MSHFSHYEQIKKFILLGKHGLWGWRANSNIKIKRRNILEKYSDLYLKIFEKNV